MKDAKIQTKILQPIGDVKTENILAVLAPRTYQRS